MAGRAARPADGGMPPIKPSFGSIDARVRGSNHPETGRPTYVRLAGLYADGPHWLGQAYAPFDVGGQARNNLNVNLPLHRLGDRRQLLKTFDVLDRKIDQSGLMAGLDSFDQQAIDLILGRAKEAFNFQPEDPPAPDQYSNGTSRLGDQFLLGRPLCH